MFRPLMFLPALSLLSLDLVYGCKHLPEDAIASLLAPSNLRWKRLGVEFYSVAPYHDSQLIFVGTGESLPTTYL